MKYSSFLNDRYDPVLSRAGILSLVYTTPEKFKNAPITDHFVFVFDETSIWKITWLTWRHRFRKAPFSKRFLSTRKRNTAVSKFLRFEERFRKVPSLWRISLDSRANSRNKAAFSSALCGQCLSWSRNGKITSWCSIYLPSYRFWNGADVQWWIRSWKPPLGRGISAFTARGLWHTWKPHEKRKADSTEDDYWNGEVILVLWNLGEKWNARSQRRLHSFLQKHHKLKLESELHWLFVLLERIVLLNACHTFF